MLPGTAAWDYNTIQGNLEIDDDGDMEEEDMNPGGWRAARALHPQASWRGLTSVGLEAPAALDSADDVEMEVMADPPAPLALHPLSFARRNRYRNLHHRATRRPTSRAKGVAGDGGGRGVDMVVSADEGDCGSGGRGGRGGHGDNRDGDRCGLYEDRVRVRVGGGSGGGEGCSGDGGLASCGGLASAAMVDDDSGHDDSGNDGLQGHSVTAACVGGSARQQDDSGKGGNLGGDEDSTADGRTLADNMNNGITNERRTPSGYHLPCLSAIYPDLQLHE